MEKIELNIIALANSESSKGNFALILEEVNGSRRLPIIIGLFEAQSIAIALENMHPNRPLTHDLFKTTLEASGVVIDEVLISDLVEGIFHARMIGKKADGTLLEVDARSSDAIAMAVRFGCPIFTTPEVLTHGTILHLPPGKSFSNKRGQWSDYSLEELQQILEQVLQKEDYESASKIRDAIDKKQKP
jgi:hypothetical protein